MRPTALQTLTWATVAAAVASALWLAAVDTGPGTELRLTGLPQARLPLARPAGPAAPVTAAARRRNHDPAAWRAQPQR